MTRLVLLLSFLGPLVGCVPEPLRVSTDGSTPISLNARQDGDHGGWKQETDGNEFDGQYTYSVTKGQNNEILGVQSWHEGGGFSIYIRNFDFYICGNPYVTFIFQPSGKRFTDLMRVWDDREGISSYDTDKLKHLKLLNAEDTVLVRVDDETCGEVTDMRFDISGTTHLNTNTN